MHMLLDMIRLSMHSGFAPQMIPTFSSKNLRNFHAHTLLMGITELLLLSMWARCAGSRLRRMVSNSLEKNHSTSLWQFTTQRAT